MKFELKLNKEQFVELGKGAGKIGKAILVEGTKAVALNGAQAVIKQSFEGGLGSINELELDDVLKGGKKKNAPKKALFSFKKKTKGTGDDLETTVDVEFAEEAEVTIVEDAGAETIKVEKAEPVKVKKAK